MSRLFGLALLFGLIAPSALEAGDLDGPHLTPGSVTSDRIKDGAIQGVDISTATQIQVDTITVTGNAFSVGGSTFSVVGGRVGIGTTSPGNALDVNGSLKVGTSSPTIIDVNGFLDLAIDLNGNPSQQEGRIFYDKSEKAFAYFNDEADITMQVGREMWLRGRNQTGGTILNGEAVFVTGATGGIATIALAKGDDNITAQVIGLATHDIENNTIGYITVFGIVRGLDTSAFSEGDFLHLSTVTAGALVGGTQHLVGPGFDVVVGKVVVANPANGKILVTPHAHLTVGLGTANQIRAMKGDATAEAYKTLVVDPELTLSQSDTSISIGLDSSSVTLLGPDPGHVLRIGDTMTGTIILSPASGNALVTTAGNVGIGTTNPNIIGGPRVLTIQHTDNAGGATLELSAKSDNFGSGSGFGIIRWILGSAVQRQLALINVTTVGTNEDAADMTFFTATGGSASERMDIFSTGEVGIGLAGAPAATKLDVAGTFHATGDATLDGGLTVAGNVGIGITAPEAALHILKASGDVLIVSSGTAASQKLWTFEAAGDLLPGTSGQQNIGSASAPIGKIFLSEASLEFVDTFGVVTSSLSVSGAGALQFGGIIVVDSSGDLDIEASELPADGYAPTYVNVAGDSMTGQLTLSGSTLTVTGNAFSVNGSDLVVTGGEVGVGTSSPSSALHIKANTPGIVGSDPAGQIIIQALGTSLNSNAVLTGCVSDGAGGCGEHLWYWGSSSGSNENNILLNRRNALLQLGTNSIARLTIDGAGDVGIGIASPGAKLDIAGNIKIADGTQDPGKVLTSDAAGLARWDTVVTAGITDDAVTTTKLGDAAVTSIKLASDFTSLDRVTAGGMTALVDGKIGIGTTGPSSLLDIRENSGNAIVTVGRTGAINAADASLGRLDWFNSDTSNAPAGVSGRIEVVTNSSGGSGGKMKFFTGDGGTFGEKMMIDNSGNVGIGTTNPTAIFQVRDKPLEPGLLTAETNAGALIKSLTDNGGDTPSSPESALILARDGVASQAFANFARFDLSRFENVATNSRTQLDLRLSNGILLTEGNNTPTIMSLRSNGNVGIGTTSPVENLHIFGGSGNITTLIEAGGGAANEARLNLKSGTTETRLFYRDSDDSFGIFHKSITRFRIQSDGTVLINEGGGNVGIGTTSAGAALEVKPVAADNFTVHISSQNGTGVMVVDKGGNVGIGTTSPEAPLHVVGDSTITANAFTGGFTELGSGSPRIKMKKLTGTTGAAEGNAVNVAHGLTLSKIIGLQVLVTADNGNLIPPEFSTVAEFQYGIFIDPTNVVLDLSATNSANLLSNAFTVLLTYEE